MTEPAAVRPEPVHPAPEQGRRGTYSAKLGPRDAYPNAGEARTHAQPVPRGSRRTGAARPAGQPAGGHATRTRWPIDRTTTEDVAGHDPAYRPNARSAPDEWPP